MDGPAYRILTPRLCIRAWNPVDAPALAEAIGASLDHLRPWMPWIADEPMPLDDRITQLRLFRARFDGDDDYIYGIWDRAETRVLGGTGLHRRIGEGALEIGYWIRPDRANEGLVTEASAALVRVAFAVHRVGRVEIHCAPDNHASARVPEKLGFTHEATLRERTTTPDGKPRDTMIWTLFRSDAPTLPSFDVEAFDAAGRALPVGA
ncbi:MAG: GNAT family N-acetyltransferase [Myxococcales bacterium]|nr:GNAT family N-acetyltransferase [Myxococcales bacterium]